MVVTIDMSDDFDIFDNQETITYRRMAADGSYSDTLLVPALQRAREHDVTGSPVQQQPSTTVWLLKASSLAFHPRRGDQIITSDSRKYELKSNVDQAFVSYYKCYCLRRLT
jgi:hypothetical protein